jgi:hypothetical protein
VDDEDGPACLPGCLVLMLCVLFVVVLVSLGVSL